MKYSDITSPIDAFRYLNEMHQEDELNTKLRHTKKVNEARKFDVGGNNFAKLADLEDFRNKKDDESELEVIDPNLDTMEKASADTYVGDYLLQCNVCRSIQYLSPENLNTDSVSEDDYSEPLICPHCKSENPGYKIVGQVGKIVKDEPKPENADLNNVEPKEENNVPKENAEDNESSETADGSPEVENDTAEEAATIDNDVDNEADQVEVPDFSDDEFKRIMGDDSEDEEDVEEDENKDSDVKNESLNEDSKNNTLEAQIKDIETKFKKRELTIHELISKYINSEVIYISLPDGNSWSGTASQLPIEYKNLKISRVETGSGLILNVAKTSDPDLTFGELTAVLTIVSDGRDVELTIVDETNDDIVEVGKDKANNVELWNELYAKYSDYIISQPAEVDSLFIITQNDEASESLNESYRTHRSRSKFKESFDSNSRKLSLIEAIVKENHLKARNISKAGTEEHAINESLTTGDDLAYVYAHYIVPSKNARLISRFKTQTGYKDEIDLFYDKHPELRG